MSHDGQLYVFWNSWILIHPAPVLIGYSDGADTARVHYGALTRTVPASFDSERSISDSMPDRLKLQGFAAKFQHGRRVWDATVEFTRKRGGAWAFHQVFVFSAPLSRAPSEIIGFLEDYPARERGVAGSGMYRAIRDRARAGQPGGPPNAAEVGVWRKDRPLAP